MTRLILLQMLKNFFQLCNNNEFRFLKYCRGLILSFTQCKMPTKIAYLSEGSHKKTTTTMYTNSRETAPILMWMHVVVVVAIIFFFKCCPTDCISLSGNSFSNSSRTFFFLRFSLTIHFPNCGFSEKHTHVPTNCIHLI